VGTTQHFQHNGSQSFQKANKCFSMSENGQKLMCDFLNNHTQSADRLNNKIVKSSKNMTTESKVVNFSNFNHTPCNKTRQIYNGGPTTT